MSSQNVSRQIEAHAANAAMDFKANGIKADVIAESTAATGVTIDGVLCKDNAVTASGGVSANLTGDVTGNVTGTITVGSAGSLILSVGALNASGSTQANAIANAAITKVMTVVGAADNAKGVALPTAVAGDVRIVKVTTAGSTTLVYPQSGAAINALGANNAYNTAVVGSVAFIAGNTTQWYTIPLAG